MLTSETTREPLQIESRPSGRHHDGNTSTAEVPVHEQADQNQNVTYYDGTWDDMWYGTVHARYKMVEATMPASHRAEEPITIALARTAGVAYRATSEQLDATKEGVVYFGEAARLVGGTALGAILDRGHQTAQEFSKAAENVKDTVHTVRNLGRLAFEVVADTAREKLSNFAQRTRALGAKALDSTMGQFKNWGYQGAHAAAVTEQRYSPRHTKKERSDIGVLNSILNPKAGTVKISFPPQVYRGEVVAA